MPAPPTTSKSSSELKVSLKSDKSNISAPILFARS